jgi:Glycosyl transferases group 1
VGRDRSPDEHGRTETAGASESPSRILTVVGLPANNDGSGYHRFYQPFEQLRRRGRHLYMIPSPGAGQPPPPSKEELEDVDVLAAQRPAGAQGQQLWDRIEGWTVRVLEIDDDLTCVDPSGLAHLADERIAASVRHTVTRSEMVTVSTPYLAEKFGKLNPNIVVLPNFIHADLLSRQRPRRDTVTVGYQGGASHLVDMCAVQEPLTRFFADHPQIDMHFIGPDWSPMIKHDCLWTPWATDIWDYYNAVDFDIGLAPLADIEFNRSKSHLKALDYAAMGIPVIASDMEPYRDFIRDGETGYLVSTPDEWYQRLRELTSDAAMREEMGAKARQLAAGYTIQGNWHLWEEAYERAAGG